MKKLILINLAFLCFVFANGQEQYKETYKFGSYAVKTGDCENNSSIGIFINGKSIYYSCGGDGMGYYDIDTVTINLDTLQDFLYQYDMKDYTSIGFLVSSSEDPCYKHVDVINVFSPECYGDVTLSKGEVLKSYILIDVDKNGKIDLLTNVIKRKNKFFPIKGFTDTLLYQELRNRAYGAFTEPRSRGIILDEP